uniref:Uncharacterized protein n=1 Tax=Meleagris gallopavo TaxID=9103 RepID=A0A803YJR4_MELGA
MLLLCKKLLIMIISTILSDIIQIRYKRFVSSSLPPVAGGTLHSIQPNSKTFILTSTQGPIFRSHLPLHKYMQAALSLIFNEVKIQNHHQDHAEKIRRQWKSLDMAMSRV